MPVSRLLEAHFRQILGMEEAAVRRLFAVYRQAELELGARLAQMDASGREQTFTAQHLALIRAQVDSGLRQFWAAGGRDLREAFEEALRTGAAQAHAEIVDLERRFGVDDPDRPLTSLPLADRVQVSMPVIPAQRVAFLADDQNLLLARFRDGVFREVSRELSLSALTGESISQASRRLSKVMKGERYQLERIARTEINHAANVGHFHTIQAVADEFPEMGLKKQWSAHLDGRECSACRSLHLQVRAVGKEFEASNGWKGHYGPCHPNCRCRVMPYSERWEARSVKKIADEGPGTAKSEASAQLAKARKAKSGGPADGLTFNERAKKSLEAYKKRHGLKTDAEAEAHATAAFKQSKLGSRDTSVELTTIKAKRKGKGGEKLPPKK